MITVLRIGTGLAILLAFVSANLWHRLRAEQQLTAELREQIAESTNRGYAAMPAQRGDARAESAAPAPTNSGANPESLPRRLEPVPAASLNAALINSPERDLMSDPEYRKARLIQARMGLKRIYTGLAEEVGLSEKEIEQLFDILASQQVDPALNRSANAEDPVRALLGPDRQAKWQDYQQTLSARSRASQMSGMLASSGAPLTEAQLRPLTTALIAEEKFVREQQPASRLTGPMTPELRAQQQEDSINRQEESNRRYLETAAPYMSAQQLTLVRETLEQQIAISRANARMQRQRAEAAAGGY